jgi:hypothetical protein
MSNTTSPWNWPIYLQWMFTTVLVTITTVGVFNVFIDPLGVFGSPRVEKFNSLKPHLDHHLEFSRFRAAVRLCNEIGVFGNSRAENGFDPESQIFQEKNSKAFNHAIPGSSIGTALQQMNWLQSANCLPKNIIIGVEFFDFLGGSEAKPTPTLKTHPVPTFDSKFLTESVFSLTGLRDSFSTINLQRTRYPAISTDHGFNPLLNYISEVEKSGHYALFRQRAEENIRSWKRKTLRLKPAQGGVSEDEAWLAAFLAESEKNGSTVHIVIYPYHAQIRLIIEKLGMGDLFTAWKRLIFDLAQAGVGRGGRVKVWDFSGVAPETLEAIPEKGDKKTQLKYYWEAGHFKKDLGNLVLARIYGADGDFGRELKSESLEAWLLEDRGRVTSILGTPSPLVTEVEDLLARSKRNPLP